MGFGNQAAECNAKQSHHGGITQGLQIAQIAEIPRLRAIRQQLDLRMENAVDIRVRLQNAMDFVCGVRPTPPCGAATATPPSDGILDEIERSCSGLFSLLNAISDEVDRLERVVG